MTSTAVLVPMLGRGHTAKPLAESLWATTTDARLVFLCTAGDSACKPCQRVRGATTIIVPFPRENGDYARKVNYGVSATEEPWLFQGACDLRFHSDWLTAALMAAQRRRKRVVGTNDLGNRMVLKGRHSTHSLVARSYVEEIGTVDEPGKLLHEGYRHNFVDNELVQAAIHRHEFVFCAEAVVEHLHPNWGKGEWDDTYEIALDGEDMAIDRMLFMKRRRIWKLGKVGKVAVTGRRRG